MKIGIAGSGMIVPDFLNAAVKISRIQIQGIYGREKSREKIEKIASDYSIPNIYYDFEEMLKSKEIDVVYIALPNNLHYKFAKEALMAGKNVIVEKPFTSNFTQAEELVQIAMGKRLFLFEAITNQYFPSYKKVKELIPKLGEIKIVELNYSQYSSRYDAFKKGEILPVFNYKKSGGALMDINIYNIYFIIGLFGKPDAVHYYPNIENKIDTSGILIMEYHEFKCTAIGAKDCSAPLKINIQGDRACIYSSDPANAFSNFTLSENTGKKENFNLNSEKERLYYELLEFLNIIEKDDYRKNIEQMNNSLTVMKILDNARINSGIEIF